MLNSKCPRPLRPFFFLMLGLSVLWVAALRAQDSIQVEAITVEPQPLVEEVPLTGSIRADQVSQLSSQVSGLVRQLHVDIGDKVDADDLLLELDDELRQVERDRARAQATEAEEQWSESQRRLREAGSLAEGSIAASEIRSLEAEERVSRAQRDAARAELRRLEAEVERHQVKAPFSGTLSAKLTEEGEWVNPGDALLELVATDRLRAEFQIPQRYFPRIKSDSEVRLTFDAYPTERFTGRIYRKVPLSQAGARTFLLRVALPDEVAAMLIPGMSSSGHLRLDTEKTGLAVPRDALIRYPDGRVTVWVVTEPEWGEESQVREQRVETGMSFAGLVEIRSGLSDGDVVAIRGNEALQEGQTVIVRQATASSDDEE